MLHVDVENGRYVGTHYGVDLALLDLVTASTLADVCTAMNGWEQ